MIRRISLSVSIFLSGFFCSGQPSLRFAVTGDTPYAKEEEAKLLNDILRNNENGNTDFLIHVGDILSSGCREEQYQTVASILSHSTVPVFIIPGDNEWNDCADPDAAWNFWQHYFMEFEKKFNVPFHVRRQPDRQENFAFVHKNVLVIGLNNVGGRMHDTTGWINRLEENSHWTEMLFLRYGNTVSAAVVFGHSMPNLFRYKEKFLEQAAAFKKPVVYIQGDSHRWYHVSNWHAENISHVVIDQGGVTDEMLKVEVVPECDEPFIFYRNGNASGNRCVRMNIYPHPVDSEISVEIDSGVTGAAEIRLYDRTGRLQGTYRRDLPEENNTFRLDVSHLADGLYIIQAITPEGNSVKKFLKF